jgi:hypothetical protein
MNNRENQNSDFFIIKVIQSGDTIRKVLSEKNLNIQFRTIVLPLLRDLNLKEKEIFFSNDSGKMVGDLEFKLPLKSIIEKFGTKLNLYSEKIL